MVTPNDTKYVRLFSGLLVQSGWHSSLLSAQRELQSRFSSGVKWSPAENLHITVRFIGDVPQAQAQELIQAWNSLYLPSPLPMLQLAGFGCFPQQGPERVVWAGVRVVSGAWQELVRGVDTILASSGVISPPSDPILHVTLGRVRDPRAVRGMRQVLSQMELHADAARVETVGLFRSVQDTQGSRYILEAETAKYSHDI